MKAYMQIVYFLFISASRCLIIGRQPINYVANQRFQLPSQNIKKPMANQSFNKIGQFAYKVTRNPRTLQFNSVRQVIPQRKAQLSPSLHPYDPLGNVHNGENLNIKTHSQGTFGHTTMTQVHYYNPAEHSQPAHQIYIAPVEDGSLHGLTSHMSSLINNTQADQPIAVDPNTVKLIISYLQELDAKQSETSAHIPNEEYENQIKILTDRLQAMEQHINSLEAEKSQLLAAGHVAQVHEIEQQEQVLEHQEDQINLELYQKEDEHMRDEIQQINQEEQVLEAQGGHDIELASFEIEKADLEIQDATIDQEIKNLEVANITHEIAALEEQKIEIEQTSHDESQVHNIETQVASLEEEKASVETDTEIKQELEADIQEVEYKIEELSPQPEHTNEVIALLRVKRKLKRAVKNIRG